MVGERRRPAQRGSTTAVLSIHLWVFILYATSLPVISAPPTVEGGGWRANVARECPRPAPGDFVLDFGKHRGQALSEVPREYLKWLQAKVTDKPLCRDAVEAELSTRIRAGQQAPDQHRVSETEPAPRPGVEASAPALRALAAQVTSAEYWLSRWALPAPIRRAFRECGVQELFPWQIDCLEHSGLLAGRNVVVSASTSAGKSLIADVALLRALTGGGGADGGGRRAGAGGDNDDGEGGFLGDCVERGAAEVATSDHSDSKVIYIVPFVSLVQQRSSQLRRLTAGLAGPGGIRISECYGQKGTKLSAPGAEIAVCTIEKANSLVNRLLAPQNTCILSLVVVDEAHMVADSERGTILELTIAKIRALLPRTQLLALSATLHDDGQALLSRWLNATGYSTSFRPLDLREHYVVDGVVRRIDCLGPSWLMSGSASASDACVGGSSGSARGVARAGRRLRARFGGKDRDFLASLCIEGLEDGQSVMVFCASKAKTESCARLIAQVLAQQGGRLLQQPNPRDTPRQASISTQRAALLEELARSQSGIDPALAAVVPHGVAFHHAGLTVEERELIQDAFSAGAITVLACTSTLAAGVNLPAGRVIVREPYVGMQELDITRYRQMVGRAGRKGFDSAGECYMMIKPSELALAARLCVGDLPLISSAMCASLQHAHDSGKHAGVSKDGEAERGQLDGDLGAGREKEGEMEEEEEEEEAAIRRLVLEAVVHGVDAHQLLANTLLATEEKRGGSSCHVAELAAGEEGEVWSRRAAEGTGKWLRGVVYAAVEWLERNDFIRAKGLVAGLEGAGQGGTPKNEQTRSQECQSAPRAARIEWEASELEASELGVATVSSGLSPEQGLQVDRACLCIHTSIRTRTRTRTRTCTRACENIFTGTFM